MILYLYIFTIGYCRQKTCFFPIVIFCDKIKLANATLVSTLTRKREIMRILMKNCAPVTVCGLLLAQRRLTSQCWVAGRTRQACVPPWPAMRCSAPSPIVYSQQFPPDRASWHDEDIFFIAHDREEVLLKSNTDLDEEAEHHANCVGIRWYLCTVKNCIS